MTTQPDRGIRTICVAGAGIVGMSAALAFARCLPQTRVTLLATPDDPAAITDRLPLCQPSIRQFHALIGLDEIDLVRSGSATHRIATHYTGGGHGDWYHVAGEYGLPANSVPFHQLWLRSRQQGESAPFDKYSLAALLAAQNKFVHPQNKPGSPLASFDYALRLDPDLYAQTLTGLCDARSIKTISGAIVGTVLHEDGGLEAVILPDGQHIEADLFIDCTGPSAVIISTVTTSFEDWGQWMPANRLRLESRPMSAVQSSDHVTLGSSGWQIEMPIDGRMLIVTAQAESDAKSVVIRPGRRPDTWVRNVLALGDAALVLGPLVPVSLTIVHNAILRALALLPARDFHPLELREYNRRSAQEAMRVRDFLILHHFSMLTNHDLPDSLAHTIDQFGARGRLPFYEEEVFSAHMWTAALIGAGFIPCEIDPAAMGVDMVSISDAMRRFADGMADIVRRVPSYPEYLAQMKKA